MKKYLLTIFGDFNNHECEEIARCMEPLIDSTHLKFQYRNGVILFHFASEILNVRYSRVLGVNCS
jgi:hypothetical protein